MIKNVIVAAACSFTLLAALPAADAGRGGSDGVIRSAIRSNNADAIISAMEQSENIPCNTDCMSMVMDLLDHDEYAIRQVASWWFARRPAQMKEVAELATAWLTVGSSVEARNGADILGTFGYAKFIPVLSAAAVKQTLSASARAAAVQALGNIANMDANPVVVQAMGDADASVRLNAVVAWKNMLKQSDAQPVVALVADSDLTVRRAAVATVGNFRVASARTALETAVVGDADPALRRNAAWSLGRIGDAASHDALVAATTDESSMVRMTAKVALAKLR
jgi:HEAT repeat protein